jgi:hypothetical protein
MFKVTHPILGEVEFVRQKYGVAEWDRWETQIEVSGRTIRLDINIEAATTANPNVLDSVSPFIADPAKFDRLARAAMPDNEVVRDYMDHTLDRSMCRDIDVWLRVTRCFGIDDATASTLDRLTMDLDQFLSKLYLRRIGLYPQGRIESPAVFDYTMGDRGGITNYLIVARFDGEGKLSDIDMES